MDKAMTRVRPQFGIGIFGICILLVSLASAAIADEPRKTLNPQPNPPLAKKELLALTGKPDVGKLSRDVRILWLYGPEDHRGGEHD